MPRAKISGASLMVLASGCFVAGNACVKALGRAFPFFEAVFFRHLLGLPVVCALLRRSRHSAIPASYAWLVWRGALGLGATSCYYYALERGKLADVVIIGRTSPLLVALLAPLLLAERPTGVALAVSITGMLGAMLVVKPGFALDLPSLVALVASVLSACAHVLVRKLSHTDPVERIVLFHALIGTAGSGLLAMPGAVMPTGRELLLLLGAAMFATAGQLLMTRGYGREKAPVVAAASHSGVVFALALGLAAWNELPDVLSLVGGAVIVCGALALQIRSAEQHNKPRPAAGTDKG